MYNVADKLSLVFMETFLTCYLLCYCLLIIYTFVVLCRELLNAYSNCQTGSEVISFQNSWLASNSRIPKQPPCVEGIVGLLLCEEIFYKKLFLSQIWRLFYLISFAHYDASRNLDELLSAMPQVHPTLHLHAPIHLVVILKKDCHR